MQIAASPVVVRVVVSNRFRRPLADTVSPVGQPALCVLDVADLPLHEAVMRTGRRALVAYKHAYYDPNDLDALLERVSRERGDQVDIACYCNDRKPPRPTAAEPAPTADQVRAPRWPKRRAIGCPCRTGPRATVLPIEDNPEMVQLDICGDTQHIPQAALEAWVRSMESVTVAAVTDA